MYERCMRDVYEMYKRWMYKGCMGDVWVIYKRCIRDV